MKMSDEIRFTNRNGIGFNYGDLLELSCLRDEATIIRVSFLSYDHYSKYFSNKSFDEINTSDMLGILERRKLTSNAVCEDMELVV